MRAVSRREILARRKRRYYPGSILVIVLLLASTGMTWLGSGVDHRDYLQCVADHRPNGAILCEDGSAFGWLVSAIAAVPLIAGLAIRWLVWLLQRALSGGRADGGSS